MSVGLGLAMAMCEPEVNLGLRGHVYPVSDPTTDLAGMTTFTGAKAAPDKLRLWMTPLRHSRQPRPVRKLT
ncbi:hypothetical protein Kisp01_70880 [Kineosporia sp. NBRC 101677]|nr:hypothetical protein Kisp01_70880 [Kineosporia sp. NBRC 101677]